MAEIISTVQVMGDDGQRHTFGPGDDVPKWAAVKMGAHCFEGGKHPFAKEHEATLAAATSGDAAGGKADAGILRRLDAIEETLAKLAGQTGGDDGSGEPPRSGKGSGRDEWAAYAASIGVDVADDASRDDIITAVDAAQK